MAQIKIRRKRHMMWWPVLLVILALLAWYFLRVRERQGAVAGPERDTTAALPMAPPGSVPVAPSAAPAPSSTAPASHAPASPSGAGTAGRAAPARP